MPATVTVESLDKMTHLVIAGPHTLVADEPSAKGGDDKGPDPYALLLSSLGT